MKHIKKCWWYFIKFFYNSFFFFFLVYIKMSEITDLTHYQKNRNIILNKAKHYNKNNKERLKEQREINTEAF